ncbi:EAL domain-containing protein [Hyphomicrobium sp. xq]|uniref:EAL domain-containing protein n=1 Tax=Hyphomicrobium album TaxID=2665159 RepID=A0A6I3KLE2_9HYPH|nr:EAL domain-containing protein [Hyphomicrobium album]MTD95249.1 EAL domain-containing protein [Hyphomicrobium album]
MFDKPTTNTRDTRLGRARTFVRRAGERAAGFGAALWEALDGSGKEVRSARAVADAAVATAATAHARLREALEILPQGIVFLDNEGRYILWNQKYADIYKRSADLFKVGARLEDTLRVGVARGDYPSANGREEAWIKERLNLLYEPGSQHEQVLADGRCILIEERKTGDGGIIGLRMDITGLKQREASFRLLFDENPVPMFVLRRDTQGFLAANAAAVSHYGFSREELLCMRLPDLQVADDAPEDDSAAPFETSVTTSTHRARDGRAMEVVSFSRQLDYEGTPALLIAVIDVTERKEAEARIAYMAHHDSLTDLPNRVLFRQHLSDALAKRSRTGGCVGALCIDLDNFKLVNDTLGHPVGDRLLQDVAERIKRVTRDRETAARLGGDEFAMLVPDVKSPQDLAVLAQRLIDVISEPYITDGHVLTVGTTIGIAVAPTDGDDADRLLRNADLALYRAKADGKSTFRFFEPEMDAQAQARRQLEIDLRSALAAEELEVHYQPLVDLETHDVVGFEALLRWPHASRGYIPPSEFIPLAEETGLITPLGNFALRRACADATEWPEHVKLAVNLSPMQFRVGNIFVTVSEALRESGLAPERLDLEITESVLLDRTDQVIAHLHALRALGVRISMDDFGTGYSSLSYLRAFPFDKIKIDRSFVRGLQGNPQTLAIVRAILGLAEGLDMRVVAEGIETQADLACLAAEGCKEGQGFYFSEARPQGEVLKLLREAPRRQVA